MLQSTKDPLLINPPSWVQRWPGLVGHLLDAAHSVHRASSAPQRPRHYVESIRLGRLDSYAVRAIRWRTVARQIKKGEPI